jgi:TfoX/Sxy family transcriptional regulator of competence genes
MAFDETLVSPLRQALAGRKGVTEKKMFGGVCFMLRDHMLCGIGKQGFMFRVGADQLAEALRRAGTRPMELGGRRMRGFVWVDPQSCRDSELRDWVALAERNVARLPAKPVKAARRRKSAG